jgi:hypothetical protein
MARTPLTQSYELDEAVLRLTGNHAGDIARYDEVHAAILDVAAGDDPDRGDFVEARIGGPALSRRPSGDVGTTWQFADCHTLPEPISATRRRREGHDGK